MFKNVQTTNEKHNDIIELYPKLKQYNNDFNNSVELIIQNDTVHSTVKLGTTDQKNSAKVALANTLFNRCCTAKAFANEINDLELKALVDVSESLLKILPNEELSLKAKAILEKLKQYTTQLADYGMSDEDINELENDITEYDSRLGNKESKSQTSVAAKIDLNEKFAIADKILEQLDNIIQGLSKKHAEYCKNYFLARNIKNLGGGHGSGSSDPGTGGGSGNGNDNPPKADA
jgi:uncharacterized protein YxjI